MFQVFFCCINHHLNQQAVFENILDLEILRDGPSGDGQAPSYVVILKKYWF